MKEDFPKIDDLISGINDPDVSYMDGLRKAAQKEDVVEEKTSVKGKSEGKSEDMLDKTDKKTMQVKAKENAPTPQPKTKISDRKQKASVQEEDPCWHGFMDYLQHLEGEEDKLIKNGCPIVRLERVLAATIDECNISNRSRSEIVNAIVQSFLDTYMSSLLPYRTKTKTLFEKYNPTKQ